jgi:hypothetical protein
MKNDQRELAQELLDLCHLEGEAEDMSLADLLDNLATLGLALRRSDSGEAFKAYYDLIGEANASA